MDPSAELIISRLTSSERGSLECFRHDKVPLRICPERTQKNHVRLLVKTLILQNIKHNCNTLIILHERR